MKDIESLLEQTLDATAKAAVSDRRTPPQFQPDALQRIEPAPHRRAWLAPMAAAAAVIAVAGGGLAAVSVAGRGSHRSATTTAAVQPVTNRVHITSPLSDGETVGVGMPVALRFSKQPGEASVFASTVKVTVNGKRVGGAWFWQPTKGDGFVVEAQYRMQDYWPAHAKIALSAPLGGLSAGGGLVYDNDFSLAYSTGASHVSTVEDKIHKMTVTSDGKPVKKLDVSLGAPTTPTLNGIKVISSKELTHQMTAPESSVKVSWAMRLTNSGEFVYAAPWNAALIGKQNKSAGGTQLTPSDAKWFFQFSQLGDVIVYKGNTGETVQSYDGYGAWNLTWYQWTTQGLFH